MASKIRVLFVCMGNICRSPVGEAVLRKTVADRSLESRFEIDSAGTIDYHAGERPDPRMREAAGRRGYALEGRARQILRKDFERFDLIVAMDRDNYEDILGLDPHGRHTEKVQLLCDFVPECATRDVPDPYYGGARGFDRVIDLIEEASGPILYFVLRNGRERGE